MDDVVGGKRPRLQAEGDVYGTEENPVSVEAPEMIQEAIAVRSQEEAALSRSLEGITGYHLAEPMTSESILADIKRVLADADRAQIAKNARNFVFSKYSWEHVTQRFEAQIQDWFG